MSQNKINIGGDPGDAFYRYKRDRFELKHEQKHGGQTKLVNLDRICLQLHTSRDAFVKYLQKKLACSKIGADNLVRQIVQVQQVEAVTEKYVARYILCPLCHLPEWDGDVCKACGHQADALRRKKHKKTTKQAMRFADDDSDANLPGLSELMHDIYELRGMWMQQGRDVTSLDRLNDECWSCKNATQLAELHTRWETARV